MDTISMYTEETLTGAVFELRVSPFETIMSVKAKIFRVEGIPMSQQHLIWQNKELSDELSIRDYHIPDSASLKLVLGMRGGPINTRRISYVTSSDAGGKASAGGSSNGSASVTPPLTTTSSKIILTRHKGDSDHNTQTGKPQVLFVFKEGDEINFLRMVDRGDGTLTPDAISANSHQDRLSIGGVVEDSDSDSFMPNRSQGACAANSKVNRFRSTAASKLISTEEAHQEEKLREKLQVLQWKMEKIRQDKDKQNATTSSNKSGKLAPIVTDSRVNAPSSILRRSRTPNMLTGQTAVVSDNRVDSPRIQPESADQHAVDKSSTGHQSGSPLATGESLFSYPKLTSSSIQKNFFPQQSKAQDSRLSASSFLNTRFTPHPPPRQQLPTSGGLAGSIGPTRQLKNARFQLATTAKAQPSSFPSTSGFLPTLSQATVPPVDRLSSLLATPGMMHQAAACNEDTVAPTLPANKRPHTKRCALCNKKTGLASSYLCRCGENFCARHRYAELHQCSFDYKTEGRRFLKEANPVIAAPKLPKI